MAILNIISITANLSNTSEYTYRIIRIDTSLCKFVLLLYIKLLFKAIGTDNAKKLSDEVIRITRHGISRSH